MGAATAASIGGAKSTMTTAILTLSLAGFLLSLYISRKKAKGEKLVCLIGDDCDKVVRSRYSSVLGVSNETLGMLYYGAVAGTATLPLLGISTVFSIPITILLIITGGLAAIFSGALILIQTLILKEWCEYCLASAGISIAIFILEISSFS